MPKNHVQNYGPLTPLIGRWVGSKGVDISPEVEGEENNEFYETIEFTPAGRVVNAEEEEIFSLHYRQLVFRISDDKKIHDQTGYWMWSLTEDRIMHGYSIPRGLSVLAVGEYTQSAGTTEINVAATANGEDGGGIVESIFLADKAKTRSFSQSIQVGEFDLSYQQTMLLEIYGRQFEHTDRSHLRKS